MTKIPLLSVLSLILLISAGCSSKTGVLNQEQTTSMPIYGNWCGLAYPQDISTMPQTVDKLDLICKQHDMCYVDKGMYSCECDVAMKQNITDLTASGNLSIEQKAFAQSFKLYMSNSICEGNAQGKTGLSRLLNNVIDKSKQGYNALFGDSNKQSEQTSDESLESRSEASQEQ